MADDAGRIDHGAEAERTLDLQGAMDRQTALLHELDHHAKNNLQVILSLILMQARRSPDDATKRALLAIADRINALSTVQRLLAANGTNRFDLEEFIGDLTGDLLAALPENRVVLVLAVEPVSLDARQAAPLALLLNELVGQALKDLPDGAAPGRLAITAGRPEGSLRIVVEDDGLQDRASATSNDLEFSRQLIEIVARQLQAEVAFSALPHLNRAVVSMPLSQEEQP